MLRLGLCCAFRDQPVRFATTTAASLQRLPRSAALEKLNRLCLANADALSAALQFCAAHDIGCFRINSQILPLKTHPECGYEVDELPDAPLIEQKFRACGRLVRETGLRTCFHPDQFVVLNSRRPEVVASSLQELEYQAQVAEWVEADVINIHGGGAYGNPEQALNDFARAVERLSERARKRLTVENDDRIFSPADLLPVCRRLAIPLVYDAHHHRCHPDTLSIEEATDAAIDTWNREPLFHLSSPQEGWSGTKPERHHDFIHPDDVPDCWRNRTLTVEVEARAKEAAVLRLQSQLKHRWPEAFRHLEARCMRL